TTLSNNGILSGNDGYRSFAMVIRAGYVTLSRATESSRSVIGGSEVRFGKIADQMTSERPVFARIDSSIRSRICVRIIVARVGIIVCDESSSISIGGSIK